MVTDGGKTRIIWAVQARNPWRMADSANGMLGMLDQRWAKCKAYRQKWKIKKDGTWEHHSWRKFHPDGGEDLVDTKLVDGIAWYPYYDWESMLVKQGTNVRSLTSFKLPPKENIKFDVEPVCTEVMEAISKGLYCGCIRDFGGGPPNLTQRVLSLSVHITPYPYIEPLSVRPLCNS